QHGLCGAPQPRYPPAGGGGGAAGRYLRQTGSRRAPAAGIVARVSQFLLASYQLTRAVATASADPWDGLRHAVAALHARDGGGTDGLRLDAARGTGVSCATLAAAGGSGGHRSGGKQHGEGAWTGDVRPHGRL